MQEDVIKAQWSGEKKNEGEKMDEMKEKREGSQT